MKRILHKILVKLAKWTLIVCLGIAAGLLWNVWQERTIQGDWVPPRNPFYDFSMAFHVHSTYSYDGGGSMQEIIEETEKAGIDILMLNEHNTTAPFDDGWEGWNGETLVLAGVEVSSPVGHYGYITRSMEYFPFAESENMVPMSMRGADSVFIFLCHPWHPRNPIRNMTDEECAQCDGYEIFNASSMSRKAGAWQYAAVILWGWLFDNGLTELMNYPEENIRHWNSILQHNWITGLGATDAHSNMKISRNFKIRSPSYYKSFQTVKMHMLPSKTLSGRDARDKSLIIDCMKQGRVYIECGSYSNPKGFGYTAESDGNIATCGDTLWYGQTAVLTVTSPDTTDVLYRIYHNGKMLYEQRDGLVQYDLSEEGIYRAEVFQLRRKAPFFQQKERLWIITNPIILKKQKQHV